MLSSGPASLENKALGKYDGSDSEKYSDSEEENDPLSLQLFKRAGQKIGKKSVTSF